MHKQIMWQAATDGMSDQGRLELLARYRELRRRGLNRSTARIATTSAAHGVWMAKEGGW